MDSGAIGVGIIGLGTVGSGVVRLLVRCTDGEPAATVRCDADMGMEDGTTETDEEDSDESDDSEG